MSLTELPEFPTLQESPHNKDYATVSLTLGELVSDGWFDYREESWIWDYYNEEQYNRVMQKFVDYYFTREIGILPLGAWKRRYLSHFNLLMPKYKQVYELLDEGINIMQDSDVYYKGRNIYSDFPATQLGTETQDYASNATDHQNETITIGNFFDTIRKFKSYDDVDYMLVKDCDVLFSSLFTVNLNSY